MFFIALYSVWFSIRNLQPATFGCEWVLIADASLHFPVTALGRTDTFDDAVSFQAGEMLFYGFDGNGDFLGKNDYVQIIVSKEFVDGIWCSDLIKTIQFLVFKLCFLLC